MSTDGANRDLKDDTQATFLSRWSRRKLQARTDAPAAAPQKGDAVQAAPVMSDGVVTAPPASGTPPEKLPPLDSLTPQSDFTPFLKTEVDTRLKNQALKVLFTDPHYNIMDGLDIYIGDYSQPDPVPAAMLRQLNQAKSLFLFDDEEAPKAPPSEGVEAITQASETNTGGESLLEHTGMTGAASGDHNDQSDQGGEKLLRAVEPRQVPGFEEPAGLKGNLLQKNLSGP